MKKKIVAVVGPGRGATTRICELAYKVGNMIAQNGWVLINGGVAHGVMDWSAKGASEEGGEVIGVLPHGFHSETHPVSEYLTIPISTTLGAARNTIIAQNCTCMIAVGMCPGTLSEVAFAIKEDKPVICLAYNYKLIEGLKESLHAKVHSVATVEGAEYMIKQFYLKS